MRRDARRGREFDSLACLMAVGAQGSHGLYRISRSVRRKVKFVISISELTLPFSHPTAKVLSSLLISMHHIGEPIASDECTGLTKDSFHSFILPKYSQSKMFF